MRTRLTPLAAILCALTLAPRLLAADDAAGSDPKIEEQLKRGIALRLAGNDEAALATFLDVEKRSPDSVRVLLHITTAAEATGKWRMAYEYLQKAAAHRDDPYYQRHLAAIEEVERSIAQRVGRLRVRGSPAGADVRLNGELVGTLPMNEARAVEAGSYLLEVRKAGYYAMTRPVSIAGGDVLTQEVVDLREQRAVLSSSTDRGTPGEVPRAPGQTAVGTQTRWVTWALAGGAAAAAVTSGVALILREQNVGHWNDNSRCLSSASPNVTRDQLCSNVNQAIKVDTTVAIAGGIAAVGLGGAAFFTWWSNGGWGERFERSASTGAQVSCRPGLGSLSCSGSF